MKDISQLSVVEEGINRAEMMLCEGGITKDEVIQKLIEDHWGPSDAFFIATAAQTKLNQFDWANGSSANVVNTRELLEHREVSLILVRGLPGSGKNTFAEKISDYVFSADDYFMTENGEYKFDGSKLGEAHADCLKRTKEALRDCNVNDIVVVANTFSQHWEMAPYLYMFDCGAPDFMPDVNNTVIDLYDNGCCDTELLERNTHDVPLKNIQDMRERWEHNWREGKMTPPWERS